MLQTLNTETTELIQGCMDFPRCAELKREEVQQDYFSSNSGTISI